MDTAAGLKVLAHRHRDEGRFTLDVPGRAVGVMVDVCFGIAADDKPEVR